MKIALFVFRYGPSQGSILQTYALATTLEKLGHQVTIINRQNPIDHSSYKRLAGRIITGVLNGRLSRHDFYLGNYPAIVMSNLKSFIDEQLRGKTITIYSDKQLNEIGNGDFDAFVIGSDQVWRPGYVYNIFDYFLDFVPQERRVKRMSYAASFGTSEWEYTKEQEQKCALLAQRFDGVSVREEDGIRLCKEHFRIEAEHVLDPTLLLKADDYRRLKSKEKKEEQQYIGYNYLDETNQKMNMVEMLSETLHLPYKSVNSVRSELKYQSSFPIVSSIQDWLAGIDDANFVIVDSFHATVFSIIFHKNFITIANKERGIARFTSLLSKLGLEDRLVIEGASSVKEIANKPIDWNMVDKKITVLRNTSIDYIKKYI